MGSFSADCASWTSSPCGQLGAELVRRKGGHTAKALVWRECWFGCTTCQFICNVNPHLGLNEATW